MTVMGFIPFYFIKPAEKRNQEKIFKLELYQTQYGLLLQLGNSFIDTQK